MGFRAYFVNCGKCKRCKADKKAKPHGPYLLVRISRTGGRKEIDYIGRLRPKPPLPQQQCPVCGETFTPKTTWQSYCKQSCRQLAYMKRQQDFPQFYSGESPQKASEPTMTEQREATQPPAQPPPAPAEAPAPAPTLASLLLAVVERWHEENRLTETEFQDAIEQVWQSWPPK